MINKIPFDKKLHLVFGAFIALIVMLGVRDYGIEGQTSVIAGAIACFVAGLGKEIYDKVSGKGTPERLDFFYTVFGGFLAVIIYELIKAIV